MSGSLPLAWMIARAAGLVTFGLLTLSVWLGLAMSTRLLGPKRQRRLLELHRTLVWTGLTMIVFHVGALMLDPVMHFSALGVLVPFGSAYKPVAVAAGVVAAWLSLMLATSFRMRKWIGQKGWRRLHYASFGAFALSLGHALYTGTDLRGLGGPILVLLAACPVLWLTFYRLLIPQNALRRPPAATPAPSPT